MSSTDPTRGGSVTDPAQTVAAGKGKGKATDVPQDVSMGEDDSSSDEETGAEDEVCLLPLQCPALPFYGTWLTHCARSQRKSVSLKLPSLQHIKPPAHTGATAAEEEDEDNMEEIDTDNIISDGRRTRGKSIDFAKAAEAAGDTLDDDDDEDDDDFEEKEDDHEMKD